MKIAIVYTGLVRGFKYEYTYGTHKKFYDELQNNNIDFDVYFVTNDLDYDETYVTKIPNLKLLKVININEIENNDSYKKVCDNINFTTQGWSDYFHNNFIKCMYNKNKTLEYVDKNYDRYICMEISHVLEKFDIIELLKNNINYSSDFETSCGFNDRIFIAKDYNSFQLFQNWFDYLLNLKKKQIEINPETFWKKMAIENNLNVNLSSQIKILRIRTNGCNQNNIPYF